MQGSFKLSTSANTNPIGVFVSGAGNTNSIYSKFIWGNVILLCVFIATEINLNADDNGTLHVAKRSSFYNIKIVIIFN